jgi:uncharacterized protein (DUF2336 family)
VPTLEDLQDWARDPSRQKWRNLIAGLTDLFIANLGAETDEHGDAYAELVCRLLDDVASEVRKELSERVAPIDHFPGKVVRRLASDEEAAVATPMLEHSPVLTEADLLGVIDMMLPDHTRAISRRKTLGEKLTDVLVKHGDQETVRVMAANPGARFSPKTYRLVAERAKTDVDLQESLVSRDDLSHVISLQIKPFLSEELKARLRALEAPPEGGSLLDSLTEITSEAEKKAKARKERAAIYTLVEQVRAGDANVSAETIKLCETGDVPALTSFLSGIAQLAEQTVSSSMSSANGMPLAITLRGLGLSREAVEAIGRVRGHYLNLTEGDVELWVESYGRIPLREAEKSLQLLRDKESAAAAAQQAKPQGGRVLRSGR